MKRLSMNLLALTASLLLGACETTAAVDSGTGIAIDAEVMDGAAGPRDAAVDASVLRELDASLDGGDSRLDAAMDSGPTGPRSPPRYSVRQHIELPEFLWHMTCVDGDLYSGTYGDPNDFYLINMDGEETHLTIDDTGESTRVYNLGGELYVTSEAGMVFSEGRIHSDLGGHYSLSAVRHAGQNLISRSPRADDSAVQLWGCTHAGCSISRTVPGIRVYDMVSYRDELYLLGRDPKGRGGSYNAGFARVHREGVGMVLSEDTNGIAVQGTVFDDRLFVGIANPARIRSFDGSTWNDEIGFPGFHHLGDLVEHDGWLFAVVVVDGGTPEVWVRDRLGTWARILGGADFPGYGVRSGIRVGGTEVVLNNAAGFLTVCQDRLFMSINTPTNNRTGPGYVLELVPER